MAASRLLLALALALHAGTGGAQDEPPATGDPRSGNTVSPAPPAPPPQPDPVAVPTAAADEPVAAARSAEPAGGASAAQQATTVAPDAPAASPWDAPAAARAPRRAAPPRPADEDLPPAHSARTSARRRVFERLLLALDVRYLAPATSTVADRYAVASRVGGFAATAGLTLRFGGVVPR